MLLNIKIICNTANPVKGRLVYLGGVIVQYGFTNKLPIVVTIKQASSTTTHNQQQFTNKPQKDGSQKSLLVSGVIASDCHI